VTRNNEPIQSVGVRGAVDPRISYSMSFKEWQACVGCRLDLWKWERGVYSNRFKERVIAFYGLSRQIETHIEDAKARAADRQRKRGKGRG